MFNHKSFFAPFARIISGIGVMAFGLAGLCPPVSAQGGFSIGLSSGVVADPGQMEVPVYFVLESPDSIAGVDMLLEFDPNLLAFNEINLETRFQQVSYDESQPGKLRMELRRHHPDSTYLGPLAPGTDTLGTILMDVTTQDLLMDLEAQVSFFEDPLTPFVDNRLVRSDSSFITSPELELSDGGILIRHPLYGDINDDGYPNTIADAIFFLNFLAGSQELTPRQRANSDMNRDGTQASMVDFMQLIQLIVEE